MDPIESYIVLCKKKYKPGSAYEETPVADTEYMATDLEAFTLYEFQVVAINNIGRGVPSNAVDVTTGELGKACCVFNRLLFQTAL